MPRSTGHKAQTRTRIVAAAARAFRERGVESVAIADVMRAAGLTHGGFYKHFGSRDDLIAEAAEHAFAYADQTLDHHAHVPHDPLASWVDWYVSEEHRDDPGAGRCPVAALVGDVGRADDGVRGGYDALVERYLGVLEDMLGGGGDARQQATIAVSTLVGSLVLARAIDDDTLSDEILRTVREALRHQPMPTSEAPASL